MVIGCLMCPPQYGANGESDARNTAA